jgi:chromate transport protein ChrA
MTSGAHIAGLLGYVAMAVALFVLARLSRRLGEVTHAKDYYRGYYIAIALIIIGMIVRFYFITRGQASLQAANQKLVYTLLSDGLPALGITIGLIITWHYWSWLLAERD